MSTLEIRDLHVSVEAEGADKAILTGVDLTIRAGETHAIMGPNGSGKSTLLKVMAGILVPEKGSVKIDGRVSALLELGAGFHPELSGKENVYLNGAILGLSKKEITARFDDIVEFAGLADFIDTPVKNYSSGMFVRLGFAVAAHVEPDVLLIDDIQFIAGKEGLQEEFFHTFNSLHGANKQVVISSDRMPDAIPTLEERLRGRFKWGLITDIQPPDLETRLAILRNKSERDRVLVPDETLEFIATNIATNIRELEGALIRVTAFASLNQVPITTDLAQTQLADLLIDSKPKTRTDDELLADIAAILKFPVDDLKGRSRQRPLVTGRQIAMYVFRELTDLSYPAIARLFGGRDHTTVIHANEKIQRLMSERKQIYDQVTDLLQQLKA